jgi:hypothetical protein
MPPATPQRQRSGPANWVRALALGAALNSGATPEHQQNLTQTEQAQRANQLAASRAEQQSGAGITRQKFADGTESASMNRVSDQGATKLSARQTIDRATARAEQKIAQEKTGLKAQLVGGNLLHIVERFIPGVGITLEKLHSATPEKRLEILNGLKNSLLIVRSAAGFADGLKNWLRIFIPTVETIIIPIILVCIFLPWMLIYVLFGRSLGGALSVGVQKIITMIDTIISETKKEVAKNNTKRNLLARLQQLRARG